VAYDLIDMGVAVIPPFLMGLSRRIHAVVFSFMAGVIPPLSSSTLVKLTGAAGTTSSGLGSSICTGTKSMPSKLGKTSLPVRAIPRQSETLLGIKSYRLATPLTVAPSISVSATIRALSSTGQRRLPSELPGILRETRS